MYAYVLLATIVSQKSYNRRPYQAAWCEKVQFLYLALMRNARSVFSEARDKRRESRGSAPVGAYSARRSQDLMFLSQPLPAYACNIF